MERDNPLGVDRVHKLIIRFSVPAIVGMVVNSFYNIVDRIFIGNEPSLGTDGLAAITIFFPFMIFLMAIGILFGVGGATYFAIRLGEGKPEEAEKALGNTLSLLVLSGLFFMILGQIFLQPLLVLFGASESVLPYAIEYARIILFGASLWAVSMGMNNMIRADGNPRIAMVTMFISAGSNIVLDALFIYGFKMGMSGAALATVLAQSISAIWVLFYFTGSRSRIKLHRRNLVPRFHRSVKIAVLGLPGFALQLASSVIHLILNRSLLRLGGDIAVSGMGVLNSLQTVLVMPIIGLRQGVQPIISFNFGARKLHRVRLASNLAIAIGSVIMLLGFLMTRLFPTQLIRLFNQDAELVAFGSKAIGYWFFAFPVVGLQIIASNFFQAIGRPKTAIFLTMTHQIIFLIPAILILPLFWGMNGLLAANAVAELLSAAITAVWYILAIRNLERDTCRIDARINPVIVEDACG